MHLMIDAHKHGAYEFPIEYRSLRWDEDFTWCRNLGWWYGVDYFNAAVQFLPFYIRKNVSYVKSDERGLLRLFTPVYFTDVDASSSRRRNRYLMTIFPIERRKVTLREANDGVVSSGRILRTPNELNLTVYSTDKRRPCKNCIVTSSPTAYFKLLLLLYNNNYSVRNDEEYKVIYYRGGVYFDDYFSYSFWDLLKGCDTAHFFIPDYDSADMSKATLRVNVFDIYAIDAMGNVSELINYCKYGSVVGTY